MVKDQLYGLKLEWTMNCLSPGLRPGLTEVIRCMRAELVFFLCPAEGVLYVCPRNHRNWNPSRNDYYPGRQPSYFFIYFFSTLDSLLYFLSWHKTIFWMSFTRTMVSLEIKLVTPALTATKITCNKHFSYPVVQPRSQGSLLPTLRTPLGVHVLTK